VLGDKSIERRQAPRETLSDYFNRTLEHFIRRRLNMNTKTKLAVAAALFTAIASPAFAGDQDSATLLATSGRIIEQPAAMPASAYASAATWTHRAPMRWSAAIDFQAQGSH
jgi:hypothetical protein